MNIPFLSFEYMHSLMRQQAIDMFTQFYDDQYYILGKGVEIFEQEYAAYCKTKYCVGMSNGLDALFIALKTLGIGKGDEVVVPSNTYIATVLAVSYTGAIPVFAEPDSATYNITAKTIEDAITPKTKAIIPVHLYGQACEMEAILALSQKYHLFIVEDNAQAHGATYNGKITGSFGMINATSFYPGKNLGALGDSGAITTDDPMLAQKASMLRNYGSKEKYYNEIIGYNKRLDELQARFLSIKLKKIEEFTILRQQIAAWYNSALSVIPEINTPTIAKNSTHVYHLYVIRTSVRKSLQQYLKNNDIGTLIHYPVPPFLQKAYSQLKIKKNTFPLAEEFAETSLSLPIWPGMNQEMVSYISELIMKFYKQRKSF